MPRLGEQFTSKLRGGEVELSRSIAFSPDGRELAVQMMGVDIYSVDGLKHRRSLAVTFEGLMNKPRQSLVYSPDGKRLPVLGTAEFALVDTTTGKTVLRECRRPTAVGVHRLSRPLERVTQREHLYGLYMASLVK